MKLLLDQGLPRSAVDLLADFGIDALHVSEINLSTATDLQIIEEARKMMAVVVSLDSDFHAILAHTYASSPSVVRVRVEGLRARELASLLFKVVEAIAVELETGAVASVTEKQIRVRSLPIGKKPR